MVIDPTVRLTRSFLVDLLLEVSKVRSSPFLGTPLLQLPALLQRLLPPPPVQMVVAGARRVSRCSRFGRRRRAVRLCFLSNRRATTRLQVLRVIFASPIG